MNSTIIPSFGIENIFNDTTSSLDRLFANNRPEGPSFMLIAIMIIVAVVIYYAFTSVGISGSSSSGSSSFTEAFDLGSGSSSSSSIGANPMVRVIEILFWGTFIFLLLINGLEYFFQIDVKAEIKNLLL